MIGMSEILQNFLYAVATMMTAAAGANIVFATPTSYGPIWLTVFYGIMYLVHILGGRVYWLYVVLQGIVTFVFIWLFCISGLTDLQFTKYAYHQSPEQHTGFGRKDPKIFFTLFIITLLVLYWYRNYATNRWKSEICSSQYAMGNYFSYHN
jgi:hypothetical protein